MGRNSSLAMAILKRYLSWLNMFMHASHSFLYSTNRPPPKDVSERFVSIHDKTLCTSGGTSLWSLLNKLVGNSSPKRENALLWEKGDQTVMIKGDRFGAGRKCLKLNHWFVIVNVDLFLFLFFSKEKKSILGRKAAFTPTKSAKIERWIPENSKATFV